MCRLIGVTRGTDVAFLPDKRTRQKACPHPLGIETRCYIPEMMTMEALQGQSEFLERRNGADRRKGRAPRFSKYWLAGRRESLRREEDRHGLYKPDRYSHTTFLLILLIIALSVLDAIFTLDLGGRGATELNPIMDYYLSRGPLVFFLNKYLLTFASLFVVLLYQNAYLFRTKFQVKSVFLLFLISFALIVQWELYIMASLNPE